MLLFTAYSITSDYVSDGLCVTTSGFPNFITPVSITSPAATDPAFGSSVTSLFRHRLGFSSCSANGNQVEIATDLEQITSASDVVQLPAGIVIPIPTSSQIASAPTTVLSPASNNNSSPSGPPTSSAAEAISSDFTTADKAATGIVVPAVAIISFVLGVIFYLRRRRKPSRSGKSGTKGSVEERQPYLQQKAELEAEGTRRLELEAVEMRHEVHGEDRTNEMMAADVRCDEIDTRARRHTPSFKERHELRGEECSRELDAP